MVQGSLIAVAVLLTVLSASVESYRILGLFPHPGESHYQFFLPVLRALSDKGHNLTIISYFPQKHAPANWRDLRLSGLPALSNSVDLNVFAQKPPFSEFVEFFMLYGWAKMSCQNALDSSAVAKVLAESEKYDLILMEQFNSDCMLGVAHQLKAPVIGLSSCALMPWHYDRIGAPHQPAYIPALFAGYSEKMSYKQRLYNFMLVHGMQALYALFTQPATNQMLRQRFGDDMPDIDELTKRTSMIFVNQHFSLSGPRPLPPQVVEIGGIHIQKPREVDESLLGLLDSAENGVIYISWGSMIRAETLPDVKREAILNALGRFPQYRVLWKWENETLPNQPENVLIRKWMPQREILCHPKVKVFMTHGGLLGSSEAAYCGVPVIATPMYGDQFLNSAALKNRGMGSVLHYENINTDTVYDALKIALDPTTLENARKVSYSYKNRFRGPAETAVYWAEYVAATGGAPLTRSQSIDLSWYVYHSLDIYLTLLVGVVTMLYSWIWFIRLLCGRKTETKSKVKVKSH